MAGIDTVTFDLWQTLIVDSPEVAKKRGGQRVHGVFEALSQDGCHTTLQQVRDAYKKCWEVCDKIRSAERDVTFDEQVTIFLQSISPGLDRTITPETRSLVTRKYSDPFLEVPPTIEEGAALVLSTVREKGYKVGLICNTGATPGYMQRVFLEKQGLLKYFHTLTFSDEERLSKPAAEIFIRTLERLDARPDRTVHVGDHPKNDVTGAKRVGMKAIWLTRGSEQPEVPPDARIDKLVEALGAIAKLE